MNREELNSIVDRALSEHLGAGLFNKKENGKYSLFMPLTGTGENGSAPDQLEKTVVGNATKTYAQGRKDNPQITIPFYAHRDNYRILEEAKKAPQEFLRVNPDMTGIKYAGSVDYKTNNTDVGGLIQGELSITVTRYDGYVDNVADLIENTAIISSEIPEEVTIKGTDTYSFDVETDPSNATIVAKLESFNPAHSIKDRVALNMLEVAEKEGKIIPNKSVIIEPVTAESGTVTITGVAKGNAIIELATQAENNATFKRTLMVYVTE